MTRRRGGGSTAVPTVTIAWRPICRAIEWLLLPFGQHSLYCYTLHLFVIVLMMNALPSALVTGPTWWSPVMSGTALQIGLILALWVLIHPRIFLRFAPN